MRTAGLGCLALVAGCQGITVHMADPLTYTRVQVSGDPAPQGLTDPALLYVSGVATTGWLAYSGVYFQSSGGVLTRDQTTSLAYSLDAGASWSFREPLGASTAATVTFFQSSPCGLSRCSGRMISAMPTLVDDVGDPDPARRFKLFTDRYFLYPPGEPANQDMQVQAGSINLRTAASPAGPWSADQALLGWFLTPPEIQASINANSLGGALQDCFALSEPGALVAGGNLFLAVGCAYLDGSVVHQRVVLLVSSTHAASFAVVAPLLGPAEASDFGATDFTAPSLLSTATTTWLLATPVAGQLFSGCVAYPFSSILSGELGAPEQILLPQGEEFAGGCSWDPGATASGILLGQIQSSGSPPDPYQIFATHVSLP